MEYPYNQNRFWLPRQSLQHMPLSSDSLHVINQLIMGKTQTGLYHYSADNLSKSIYSITNCWSICILVFTFKMGTQAAMADGRKRKQIHLNGRLQ